MGRGDRPLALHFPDEVDGLRGVEFVIAAVHSSRNDGRWTTVTQA